MLAANQQHSPCKLQAASCSGQWSIQVGNQNACSHAFALNDATRPGPLKPGSTLRFSTQSHQTGPSSFSMELVRVGAGRAWATRKTLSWSPFLLADPVPSFFSHLRGPSMPVVP